MRDRIRKKRTAATSTGWRTAWLHLAIIGAISVSPLPAEDLKYPRKVSESILGAKPTKWTQVELVRDYRDGEVVSYRWMIHDQRRDRRGPGVYTKSSSCILFANKEYCKVVKETADEFELFIKLEGYDKESTIRVVAWRQRFSSTGAWLTIEGSGEIYREFVAELNAVQKAADEIVWEEDWQEVPKGPGNMLRWSLRSRPAGRVID